MGKFIFLAAMLSAIVNVSFAAKPNKNEQAADPASRMMKKINAADLSSESKIKAKSTVDAHASKLKEAQAKLNAVLTSEQKEAQRNAQREARAAGKKGKELQAAIDAAVKLTEQQRSKLPAAQSALKAAHSKLQKDLRQALSPEDLAKLGLKTKPKT